MGRWKRAYDMRGRENLGEGSTILLKGESEFTKLVPKERRWHWAMSSE